MHKGLYGRIRAFFAPIMQEVDSKRSINNCLRNNAKIDRRGIQTVGSNKGMVSSSPQRTKFTRKVWKERLSPNELALQKNK